MDQKWHQQSVSFGQLLTAIVMVCIPIVLDRISLASQMSRFEARQEIVFQNMLQFSEMRKTMEAIKEELIKHEAATEKK